MDKKEMFNCSGCQLPQCMQTGALNYMPPCAKLAIQNLNNTQQLKAEIAAIAKLLDTISNQNVGIKQIKPLCQRLRQLSAV